MLPQRRDTRLQFARYFFVRSRQHTNSPDILGKKHAVDVQNIGLGDGLDALRNLIIILDNFVKKITVAVVDGRTADSLRAALETPNGVGLRRRRSPRA